MRAGLAKVCLTLGLSLWVSLAHSNIQTLPTTPPLIVAGNPTYTLDLIIGLAIPDGASGGPFQYLPSAGFTQIDSRSTPIVNNGATVGTFYDFVYEFRPDPVGDPDTVFLAIGSRVVLLPNNFEINDIFRYNNSGFTTAEAAWSRATDDDLRLYDAGRTTAKFLSGDPVTFDENTFKLRSDVNSSEGNPLSGYFYVISNAKAYTVKTNAISVYQAGEEQQQPTEIFMDGFAFTTEEEPVHPQTQQVPIIPTPLTWVLSFAATGLFLKRIKNS